MRKRCFLIVVLISFLSCNKKTEAPTQFSQEALNDTFLTLEGKSIAFKNILEIHKGNLIFIDIWASWCGDCVKGMPDVKTLQNQYKGITFLFLSLDKTPEAWIKGVNKYKVNGAHYYVNSGWNGPFCEFVDLDWIPRYMIVDKTGHIKLFKATEADDEQIKHILNQYIN